MNFISSEPHVTGTNQHKLAENTPENTENYPVAVHIDGTVLRLIKDMHDVVREQEAVQIGLTCDVVDAFYVSEEDNPGKPIPDKDMDLLNYVLVPGPTFTNLYVSDEQAWVEVLDSFKNDRVIATHHICTFEQIRKD